MRSTQRMKLPAAILVPVLAAAACTSGGDTDGDGRVKITVWSWDETVQEAVPGFMAENEDIEVEVVNAGSSFDEYSSLENAIQAGSGVPDVVMIEYFAVPYFAIPGDLTDLGEFGVDELQGDYVEAAWSDVTVDGTVYALPGDYGPSVMFYNEATFSEAGVDEPPATWEEYYEAAQQIRALGDDYYIAQDTGDLFFLLSLIWQAGGRPFQVDGLEVGIDFTDEGTTRAVEFWQRMLDEDLINTDVPAWSDDWNRTLNDGTLATQTMGGWLTATLPERAPEAAGDFRVALMPQWEEGEQVGAANGGSAFSIPAAAGNKEAAYEFLEYFTHGDGISARVDAGAFVPNWSVLEDEDYLTDVDDFFGDQQYRIVLAEATEIVATGWQFTPFFEWSRTIYADIAEPYYNSGNGSLGEVLDEWRQRSVAYGNEQGFQVQ